MNTKAIIVSTILTAVLAGSSAIAGDNDDFLSKAVDTSTAQPFVIKHAYLLTTTVEAEVTDETIGK